MINSQMIHLNNFDVPHAFPVAPSSGQHFNCVMCHELHVHLVFGLNIISNSSPDNEYEIRNMRPKKPMMQQWDGIFRPRLHLHPPPGTNIALDRHGRKDKYSHTHTRRAMPTHTQSYIHTHTGKKQRVCAVAVNKMILFAGFPTGYFLSCIFILFIFLTGP